MIRLLAGLIIAAAIFLVLYFVTIRTRHHPLLIDAGWSPKGDWCDVTHNPRPPIAPAPRQWLRKDDVA